MHMLYLVQLIYCILIVFAIQMKQGSVFLIIVMMVKGELRSNEDICVVMHCVGPNI